MPTYPSPMLGLVLCLGSLAACQSPGQPPAATPAAPPAALATAVPLVPQPLVYYFAPADTTVQTSYSGGLYLGGHPQGFDSTAGCQRRRVSVPVLGHPAPFTVQRCATGYTLDAVFDSGHSQSFDSQINTFGSAKSAAELRQLLAVFATLHRQPEPAAER